MGGVPAIGSLRGAAGSAQRRLRIGALLFVGLLCGGCGSLKPADTSLLATSGMNYDAIQKLTALHITNTEIAQILQARQAGFSGHDCVAMLEIYRHRNQPFDAGAAVAGLAQVGVTDAHILRLAGMNQLGLGWGELQAMKLAGMSDTIVMEVARQHAHGHSVLSGASLARLNDAGVRESTLLTLVRRGVPESEAGAILAYRRRGASEREILRHFAGS